MTRRQDRIDIAQSRCDELLETIESKIEAIGRKEAILRQAVRDLRDLVSNPTLEAVTALIERFQRQLDAVDPEGP